MKKTKKKKRKKRKKAEINLKFNEMKLKLMKARAIEREVFCLLVFAIEF
jgi:hypothetical protein